MNIPKIDKKKIAQGFKSFFTKNFALKVIAFVFAMLLWGYVLTDQKPVREKDVGSVSTSFDGEAELIAQGFCIRGDRSEILPDVNVKVRTQITNYAYVTPSTVLASVSLTIRVWMRAAMERSRASSPRDGLPDRIPSASRKGSNLEANSPTGNSRIT